MTIDGATVTNKGYYSSLIRNLGKSNENVATLTVTSGILSNEQFIAVKNDDYGKLKLTGGTITSGDQAVQNWNEATISGGNLTGSVITWSYTGHPSSTTISRETTITGDVKGAGSSLMIS